MSDTNETETATEEKKARKAKRNSVPAAQVKELAAGIPSYEKASFLVIGNKSGVRLAIPLTQDVSRAYFYANGDYALIPTDDALKTFSAEERKETRKGGIMAEVDFSQGSEPALRALTKLIDVIRSAPEPAKKPKPEKKAKAPAVPAETSEQQPSAPLEAEPETDSETAEA